MLNPEYHTLLEQSIVALKLPAEPKNLYDPFRYIVQLGGKRVRPQLALMAYEFYDQDLNNAIDAALAIEVFHNFSLVHDDIMDKAPLRRGKETVHRKWNENIAILSGDIMLVKAYQLLLQYPKEIAYPLLNIFSKTAAEVCEGQQMDMDFELESDVAIESYIKMIQLKTAVLLGCSLQMGAIVAGSSIQDQEALYQYGLNLGTAFQLQDDLLDVYGNPETFGKQIGGDIIANKKTFLLLTALSKLKNQQKNQLVSALRIEDQFQKVDAVTECYDALDIKALTEYEIKRYYDLSLVNISILPNQMQIILKNFAEALINRSY